MLGIKDDTDLVCARIRVQRGEKRVVGGLASWQFVVCMERSDFESNRKTPQASQIKHQLCCHTVGFLQTPQVGNFEAWGILKNQSTTKGLSIAVGN